MDSVLLLNVTYEPLQICSMRRALKLIFKNKAEVIEINDTKTINTISMQIQIPAVIRLLYYIKRPYSEVRFSKRNIMHRDGHTCQYCGASGVPLTVDHIIPRSRGGKNIWENVVCACIKCNNKKGDRTPWEVGMKLIRKPYKPRYIYTHMAVNMENYKIWEKYFLGDLQ
ncbi:MAG: HNH endonuclease [bacterium]